MRLAKRWGMPTLTGQCKRCSRFGELFPVRESITAERAAMSSTGTCAGIAAPNDGQRGAARKTSAAGGPTLQ